MADADDPNTEAALRSQVIELDMTVDQALKYIISMGVVPPLPKQ